MEIVNPYSTRPVFIKVYFDEQQVGVATGFQVHQGDKYLVTNWHVVSGRNFITKKCVSSEGALPNRLVVRFKKYFDSDRFEWVEESINLYNENDEKLWYEHPIHKSDVDVAIIPLELYPKMQHSNERFEIDVDYELEVTDPVFVLGFPLGFTIKSEDEPHAIWTGGSVASDPSLNLKVSGIKSPLPAFLIDSKTRQGQSGSPVIYYSNRGLDPYTASGGMSIMSRPVMKEIGIYSGRISEDSDLGYVWKWEIIKEILDFVSN